MPVTGYDSGRSITQAPSAGVLNQNISKSLSNKLKRKLGSYGVDPASYKAYNSRGRVVGVDDTGYKTAQADWMRGNAAFDGWTDDDISSFQDWLSSSRMTDRQKTAGQLWYANQIAQRNANAEAQRDREDMLAEIEAYRAGFSNEHIAAAVAQERQVWDQKIAETLQAAQQQAAAQGRVLDNTTYAMLRGRLEAQAAGAIQKTQMDYEQKRQEYMYNAMSMKNDVYKNTQRTVATQADLASIISAMAGK
jgi:hypothetical protein